MQSNVRIASILVSVVAVFATHEQLVRFVVRRDVVLHGVDHDDATACEQRDQMNSPVLSELRVLLSDVGAWRLPPGFRGGISLSMARFRWATLKDHF